MIAKPHPEMLHLDLSHNSFHSVDTEEIAKSLCLNQNIYGFHFEGNN